MTIANTKMVADGPAPAESSIRLDLMDGMRITVLTPATDDPPNICMATRAFAYFGISALPLTW